MPGYGENPLTKHRGTEGPAMPGLLRASRVVRRMRARATRPARRVGERAVPCGSCRGLCQEGGKGARMVQGRPPPAKMFSGSGDRFPSSIPRKCAPGVLTPHLFAAMLEGQPGVSPRSDLATQPGRSPTYPASAVFSSPRGDSLAPRRVPESGGRHNFSGAIVVTSGGRFRPGIQGGGARCRDAKRWAPGSVGLCISPWGFSVQSGL